ncbi:MAG: hypothetical protein AB7U66_18405 [Hyphomicrobiaceae bacterium]|uniref:hypothetical protein n=1 Tax=Bradyrhizobium sp. TaxID=376 RepID=UPI003D13BDCB
MEFDERGHYFAFDERGEIWNLRHPFLAQDLKFKGGLGELVDIAIQKLGFFVVKDGPGGVRIFFRPSLASEVSFAGLAYWLAENPRQRYGLCAWHGAYQTEIVPGLWGVMQRIQALFALHGAEGARFRNTLLPLDEITRSAPLGAALELWAQSGGRQARTDMIVPGLQDWGLLRYLEVIPEQADEVFRIAQVGRGYLDVPGADWFRQCLGQYLHELPDRFYADHVRQGYRYVAKTSAPRYERIDAQVRWGHEPSVDRHYHRLLLPVLDVDGRKCVLGVTSLSRGCAEPRLVG